MTIDSKDLPKTEEEFLRAAAEGHSFSDLLRWTALHAGYAIVFLSLAWSRITSKDITS